MFDLSAIQSALCEFGIQGWLLYDFRGNNVLAQRVLKMPHGFHASRRYFYFIPAKGTPQKLVHRIETDVLDHLPGDKTIYLRWQELEASIEKIVKGSATVHSGPRTSRRGLFYRESIHAGRLWNAVFSNPRGCSHDDLASGDNLPPVYDGRTTRGNRNSG